MLNDTVFFPTFNGTLNDAPDAMFAPECVTVEYGLVVRGVTDSVFAEFGTSTEYEVTPAATVTDPDDSDTDASDASLVCRLTGSTAPNPW